MATFFVIRATPPLLRLCLYCKTPRPPLWASCASSLGVHQTRTRDRNRVLYPSRQEFNQLTITERNQKLFELREKLNKARAEVAWIEQEIWLTRDNFDQQRFAETPLFEEMFGG